MNIAAPLDQIPRGNTAPGVNRAVIEYLLVSGKEFDGKAVLDVPCGRGEFLDVLKTFFPGCQTFGADISFAENNGEHVLIKTDLAGNQSLGFDRTFDLVTSISGVMEFDNTLNFVRKIRDQITDQATLIVTNDNLMSARDRVLYLFTGRLRQYPMFVEDDAPTWKILPLQNLLRILHDAGFEASEIYYVPAKWTEWLWLPIALPIYLLQTLSFALDKNGPPYKEKAARYPFASLFSRHYFVIALPCPVEAGRIIPQ
ncbi:MAG: methyltransferase domain-containing protein [Pyrinomonadaceae bacterium]